MKTKDVKCNKEYLFNESFVTVLKRIKGIETNKRNMQAGLLFTGYKHEQKKFLLSNGLIVKASQLTQIK